MILPKGEYTAAHPSAEPSKERRRANIKQVGHVVLGTGNAQRSIQFSTEALGMELVNVVDEMQMAFISFGERTMVVPVISPQVWHRYLIS